MRIEMENVVLLTVLLIMTSILMYFVTKMYSILQAVHEQRNFQLRVPEIDAVRQRLLHTAVVINGREIRTQDQTITRRVENRVRPPQPQENDERS